MTYSGQHYLKTRAEMADLFSWAPESIENTLAIAERCQFSFGENKLHLPEFPVPPGYDIAGYFEKVARDGLEERLQALRRERDAGRELPDEEAYRARLKVEIGIIRQMGFPGYFLIVWDFMRFARERGIPVGPGRGSAAGSLVAYSLRITDIDPLQYNLLFERFLNPERVSMPDIDIDFCMRKRERVIDYVRDKYGKPNVAQIITFGTMAARAVIRDVGRGLEVPYADVDRIAKLVPAQPGQDITIKKALAEVPQLAEAYKKEPAVKELLDIAQRLEGGTRHASTHAAGVVIAPKPIVEYAPLYKGTKDGDEVTTQWDKDEIEEIGLLKMDFLGLKTLTLIDDCLNSIALETGEKPNLDLLPLDDGPVFELFCRAGTSGIFQFESEGMKDILRRLKPERFEDLIALNALYRPGPIGGGLIDDFIKRRHGKVKVKYPHKLTEEILRETYGVIVYQEQVMQIGSAMAGYSLGEADILRRAMGKKKVEVMEAEEKKFVAGAVDRGISSKDAKDVFELMAFFAGYGFNKSHSAAYALVAYHTAWLKAHHPVHFMAALLTTEKGNTEKMVKYINECREMNIDVHPPDVNNSGLDFTVEGKDVRFGLSAIKKVGEGAIESILEARKTIGTFKALPELCGAADPRAVNKRVLEALNQAGALDSLGHRRSQIEVSIDQAMEYGQRQRADLLAGQSSLFGGQDDSEVEETIQLPDIPEWDEKTVLTHEKATLGFYVSGHPLKSYSELLGDFASHSTVELRTIESGTEVAIGGVIAELRRRKSKKGDWWAAMQLEDMDGQIEVLVFPKTYERCEKELEQDRPTMIFGRFESEDDRLRIIADDVCALDRLRERRVEAIQVRIDATTLEIETVDKFVSLCEKYRGDVELFFEIERAGAYRLIALGESNMRVRPSREFLDEVQALLGRQKIRFRAKKKVEPRPQQWGRRPNA
jgi:DNA polymerase-3 subunit alpha